MISPCWTCRRASSRPSQLLTRTLTQTPSLHRGRRNNLPNLFKMPRQIFRLQSSAQICAKRFLYRSCSPANDLANGNMSSSESAPSVEGRSGECGTVRPESAILSGLQRRFDPLVGPLSPRSNIASLTPLAIARPLRSAPVKYARKISKRTLPAISKLPRGGRSSTILR